jgi:hypothetical protein
MELLNTKNPQLPRYATSLLSHPFCRASDREIINVIKDYFTLTVYPISDKYLFKSSSLPIKQRVFLDGQSHTYSFKLPAGGTHLDKVLIEFPGLPISATIEGFELSQM